MLELQTIPSTDPLKKQTKGFRRC